MYMYIWYPSKTYLFKQIRVFTVVLFMLFCLSMLGFTPPWSPQPGLKMEEEGEEILMKDWAGNGAVVGVWLHVGRLDLGPGVSDWVPVAANGECMGTSKIGRGGLYIGLRVGGRRVQFHRSCQDRLGRKLGPREEVHHKDGDTQNNSLTNLISSFDSKLLRLLEPSLTKTKATLRF